MRSVKQVILGTGLIICGVMIFLVAYMLSVLAGVGGFLILFAILFFIVGVGFCCVGSDFGCKSEKE